MSVKLHIFPMKRVQFPWWRNIIYILTIMSRPQSQCDPADIFYSLQCLRHCQSPAIFTHHRDKELHSAPRAVRENKWNLILLKNKKENVCICFFSNKTPKADCVCNVQYIFCDKTKLTLQTLHGKTNANCSLNIFCKIKASHYLSWQNYDYNKKRQSELSYMSTTKRQTSLLDAAAVTNSFVLTNYSSESNFFLSMKIQ